MRYTITTDASWNYRTMKAAYAFQVKFNDKIKIRHAALITKSCSNSTEAEMMAIGHAVNALISSTKLSSSDIVFLYTDCRIALGYLTQPISRLSNARLIALRGIILGMLDAANGLKYRFGECDRSHIALRWCHNRCKELTSYAEH